MNAAELWDESIPETLRLGQVYFKRSHFKYELPRELIRIYPLEERDQARLFVYDRETDKVYHSVFKELDRFLSPGDVVVVNNVKVFPARLYARKERTNGKVEILLVRELDPDQHLWEVFADPARKVRVGNKLIFEDEKSGAVLAAEVVDNTTSRGRTIKFLFDGGAEELRSLLRQMGEMPIPKYLRRRGEDIDRVYYQTIFARDDEEYAIAASTSALHFTERVVKRLALKDIPVVEITVHIGVASFMRVEVEDLKKHVLEAEYFKISEEAAARINKALQQGKRVVAVGTSVVRALETAVSAEGLVRAMEGWTTLFIYPPYDFKIVKALITNFHEPESTNLMLTCAFGGYPKVLKLYEEAKKQGYKFLSYGDAMLIL